MMAAGVERLEIPADEAWRRLSDLERLGEALPHVQAVNADGTDGFTAVFRPTTGLGATPVRMTFTVVERSEPQRLRVAGDGGASEYAVSVEASFDLVADGSATQVRWAVDAKVHGVLRSLTQRVLPQLVADQVAAVLRTATGGASPAAVAPGAAA